MKNFLNIQESQIQSDGKDVHLKGINLGGWLLMEGYILHSLNNPVQYFQKEFTKTLGKQAFEDFEETFLSNFIREEDIQRIAKMGFNCLRVPFHHKLIENNSNQYSGTGL